MVFGVVEVGAQMPALRKHFAGVDVARMYCIISMENPRHQTHKEAKYRCCRPLDFTNPNARNDLSLQAHMEVGNCSPDTAVIKIELKVSAPGGGRPVTADQIIGLVRVPLSAVIGDKSKPDHSEFHSEEIDGVDMHKGSVMPATIKMHSSVKLQSMLAAGKVKSFHEPEIESTGGSVLGSEEGGIWAEALAPVHTDDDSFPDFRLASDMINYGFTCTTMTQYFLPHKHLGYDRTVIEKRDERGEMNVLSRYEMNLGGFHAVRCLPGWRHPPSAAHSNNRCVLRPTWWNFAGGARDCPA